jgi:tetratricopeptide (TPR) repeat protein
MTTLLVALLLQQLYPEAIGAFEQARESDPSVHVLGPGAGTTHLEQGDHDKALAALLKDLCPADTNHFWLGAA